MGYEKTTFLFQASASQSAIVLLWNDNQMITLKQTVILLQMRDRKMKFSVVGCAEVRGASFAMDVLRTSAHLTNYPIYF
jgi:hypothetical protein